MGFGGTRFFNTQNQALAFIEKARAKGLFTDQPQFNGKKWMVTVLTSRGTNPFFLKGL